MIFHVGENIWRAKIYQVGTFFAEDVEGVCIECGPKGYRKNFRRAKIYAAQGLFSTAQGERNFVQKEGRNSLS